MMGFLPLGKHLCDGRGWDDQLWNLVRRLRGRNPWAGQVTASPEDRYFHSAVRRGGDVIAEAVEQARQHMPQLSLVGAADRLIERNGRAVSYLQCAVQR